MNPGRRQIYGAIGIVVVAVFIYAARDISQYGSSSETFPSCPEAEQSAVIVELAGDENYGGIYFLQQGATLYDLFRKAGCTHISRFSTVDPDRILHSGDRVTCDISRQRVAVGDIAAPVRLAFDMPLDLNRSTMEELMLVPGIGPKTAAKIIRFRDRGKGLSSVNALKQIMNAARYNRIKDYLYVEVLLDREKL